MKFLCLLFHGKHRLAFYTATTAKTMIYVGSVCTKCHELLDQERLYNKVRSA